ncbi:MAG: DEAD/DEAH box helicase, partial [Anaerolineae bacterium]
TFCGTFGAYSRHDQYFFQRPRQMVAGIVKPPRLDLTNEELRRSHVHAMWLAAVGLSLGARIGELLELKGAYPWPLRPDIQAATKLSKTRREECIAACLRVVAGTATSDPAVDGDQEALAAWVSQTVMAAPDAFDRAFDRWREMYRRAQDQLAAAHQILETSLIPLAERRAAEGQHRDALNRRQQLEGTGGGFESEFYPYRYLANEGFLPAYNFPRLPVRAHVSGEGEGHYIVRSRFQAVREFGPGNILYDEGRKHRVTAAAVPAGPVGSVQASGAASLDVAKACRACGHFHPGDPGPDLCASCGAKLDADGAIHYQRLLPLSEVMTRPVDRITSDEEERRRQGYNIATYLRWAAPAAGGGRGKVNATAVAGAKPLAGLTFGHSATLYRVNRGWRRSGPDGFEMDLSTGEWGARGHPGGAAVAGVMPYVSDTRNVLLLHPEGEDAAEGPTLASLGAALHLGLQAAYQVDSREMAYEEMGKGDNRAVLFWEDAEGSLGVLEELVQDPNALAEVARAALDAC